MNPITEKARHRNTIKNILYNNEHNTDLIRKPPPPQKNTHTYTDLQHQKTKLVTFRYSGKEGLQNFFRIHE
jgi:hypothetical protein